MSAIGELDDQVTAAEKSVAELKRKAAELNNSTASEPKGQETNNGGSVTADKPIRVTSTPQKQNYMMRNLLVLGVIAFAAVMFFRKK
jgi:hypothetical protein